jgi:1-acyl-sn-glycerol-3-phosphate acyltransferase
VLKTSSGKIRRAASRELYERGLVGAKGPGLWWDLTALALRSVRGRLAQWRRSAAAVVYSVYLWVVAAIAAVVGFVLAVVLPQRAARQVWRAITRLAVRLSGVPVTVEGLDRVPGSGPVVVVANHASYLDGALLFGLLPARFTFAAKEEFERNLFTRIAFRKAGAFFVERFDGAKGVEDTRELSELAKAGSALAIFPEGTFTRMPGVRPFRMGAFVIAAEAGVPVVPVAFRGTRSMLRADGWIFRRGPIRVVFGEPIRPEGRDWAAAVKLRDAAREEILRHCGEPDLASGLLS